MIFGIRKFGIWVIILLLIFYAISGTDPSSANVNFLIRKIKTNILTYERHCNPGSLYNFSPNSEEQLRTVSIVLLWDITLTM